MGIYPSSSYYEDPVSALDDEDIAEIIIEWREKGFSIKRAKLEALAVCHNHEAVNRVSDLVEAERVALSNLNTSKMKSDAEFLKEAEKIAHFIDAELWVECTKEKLGVVDFEGIE